MALLSRSMRLLIRHEPPEAAGGARVSLEHAECMGIGSKRICYRHPADPGLCIKVPRHPEQSDAQQPSIVDWLYSASLDARGVSHVHRPYVVGWVETDRGRGLVVERIRNSDGSPGLKLQEALKQGRIGRDEIDRLMQALKRWALRSGVAIHDLSPGNIRLRETTHGRDLVLIDGIGGQQIKLKFLLYRRYPTFARAISRYRWPRFERRIQARLNRVTPADAGRRRATMTRHPPTNAEAIDQTDLRELLFTTR